VKSGLRRGSGGLLEPVFESGRADTRVAGRNQRQLAQLCPEISRIRIDDHFARIVASLQTPPDKFVEPESLRPGDFHHAVQRSAGGDVRDLVASLLMASVSLLVESTDPKEARRMGEGIAKAYPEMIETLLKARHAV